MARLEKDATGEISVPDHAYWGAQTERSRMYFQAGNEPMPFAIIQALIEIKRCMLEAANQLDYLPNQLTPALLRACDEAAKWPEQFPLCVWQTGSGTQTNMNVNEVIAKRANEILGYAKTDKSPIHPNDHVNYGQSSNDTFPTAMHIATLNQLHTYLLPTLKEFEEALYKKTKEWKSIITVGRTHLQDAVPITLGQIFSGYKAQIYAARMRIENCLNSLYALPQGGTAVGTGLNCPPKIISVFLGILSRRKGWPLTQALNYFEVISAHDVFVELSGQLNVLACALMKIANDIRLLGSGPRCGFGELKLPQNEPGSSIMPGKVNPTQAEALTMICCQVMGNHTAVTIAGSQGHFQLNAFKPVIVANVLRSIQLLTDGMKGFRKFCLEGIEPQLERIESNLDNCLMRVTALNPHIGYDNAAKIAYKAVQENIGLAQAAKELGFEKEFAAYAKPDLMV